MGPGPGSFLNGVSVKDYTVSGLDVTSHSRLKIRLEEGQMNWREIYFIPSFRWTTAAAAVSL